MAIDFSNIYITRDPLAIPSPVYSATAGAVLDFHGVVREMEAGKPLAGLDYESYADMAELKLRQIAGEIVSKYELENIHLIHRIGFVPTSEPSLFLRVTSGHRGEAFDAGRELIERLKAEVPIWKNPVEVASS